MQANIAAGLGGFKQERVRAIMVGDGGAAAGYGAEIHGVAEEVAGTTVVNG